MNKTTQPITKEKRKKIISYVINAVSIVIAILALFLVVCALISSNKGYTAIGDSAYCVVQSPSMEGDKADNFYKGDIIKVRIWSDEDKEALKDLVYTEQMTSVPDEESEIIGKVITFFDVVNGKRALVSHRVTAVTMSENRDLRFRTAGDNNLTPEGTLLHDVNLRSLSDVIGIYEGKASGFGKALIWLQSETGFIICVMVPSMALVAYCLSQVIYYGIQYGKKKMVLAKEEAKEELENDLKEQIRAQLLAEMEQKKEQNDEDGKSETQVEDGNKDE